MSEVLYVDSHGREHVISTMNPAYLVSALKKMEREGWDVSKYASQEEHDAVLAQLKAQAAINLEVYIGQLQAEHDDPETSADRKAEIVAKIHDLRNPA